jgi:hypothetical protein
VTVHASACSRVIAFRPSSTKLKHRAASSFKDTKFSSNYRANMTNTTYLLRLSSPLQSLFFFEDDSFLLFDLDLLDFVLVRPPSRCCCCWG